MATFSLLVVLAIIGVAFMHSFMAGFNMLFIALFLFATTAQAMRKDRTDVLTSVIYLLASFSAGIALGILAARNNITIPDSHHVWGSVVSAACLIDLVQGRRRNKWTLILVCIASVAIGTEINSILLGNEALVNKSTSIAYDFSFITLLRIYMLPHDTKPPRKKSKKAEHDKRWYWLPLPRPNAA